MTEWRAAYWYFTYIDSCPVCGYERKIKERRYTPKPADPKDRQKHGTDADGYCGCVG